MKIIDITLDVTLVAIAYMIGGIHGFAILLGWFYGEFIYASLNNKSFLRKWCRERETQQDSDYS